MIRHATFALVLAVTAAAWAEGEGEEGKAPAAQPAADASAPSRGARYKVTLRSGRSIVGIVTTASMYERRDGAAWVQAEKDTPGAGVRLFFLRDQEGFVFIPSREIRASEKQGDVTEQEGKELEKAHSNSAKRASDEREKLRKERQAREEAEKAKAAAAEDKSKSDGQDKAKGGTATTEDQIARYTALLAKYPPSKWTPDSPAEIEKRRIVMGLQPTDEEKAFLAVFDEWTKAHAAWKAGQEKAAKPAETPAKK